MRIIIEKNDSEEQIIMANALLKNGIARVVEQAAVKVDVVTKTNQEVATAVSEVTKLFGVGAQWTAVYRILVDFCGWDADVAAFCRRMNRITQGVNLTYACNYQAIQKALAANGILRKDYKAWQKYQFRKGDRVFPRQKFIADKMLKLLSINAEIYY